MSFAPGIRLELRQQQSLVLTPQLQQAIRLLQMSNLELAGAVDQEVAENPFLLRRDGEGAPALDHVNGAGGPNGPAAPVAEAPPPPFRPADCALSVRSPAGRTFEDERSPSLDRTDVLWWRKEDLPARVRPFADVRDDVERAWKMDRARTLAVEDAAEVWSLPCFFIKAGWRDRGVASALLAHALKSLKKRGAKVAEGYPVNLKPGQRLPNAFAWTGTRGLFERAGFELAGSGATSKLRMRRRP